MQHLPINKFGIGLQYLYATFINLELSVLFALLPLIARAGSGAKYDYITHVHVQCAYHKFINISF